METRTNDEHTTVSHDWRTDTLQLWNHCPLLFLGEQEPTQMSDTVTVALITASGSVAVSITALILNFRLFNSLKRRIEVIERDLKDFFRSLADHDKRLSKLEDKP